MEAKIRSEMQVVGEMSKIVFEGDRSQQEH